MRKFIWTNNQSVGITQLLSVLPVRAPKPPTNPPMMAVIKINRELLGSENIAATRSVSIDAVCISIIDAMTNQSRAIPKKPARNEDGPLVEIIKLIKKLAITMDHHGNIV